MLTGHDGPNAGFAFGDGGKGYTGGHETGFEEGAGEVHCLASIANKNGGDGRFAGGSGAAPGVEADGGKLLLEVVGVIPEALDAFGFGFEEIEGGDAGCGDRGRVRGGEEKGTRAMVEVVDEVAAAADVAAERSDGFGERAHLHVDALSAVEVIDAAASVAAENSAGMGVVDHHDGSIFVGEVAEFVYRADVAVH